MLKTIKNICMVAVVALVISGCSTRIGEFTVASTNNVRNIDYSLENQPSKQVEGSSCLHAVLFIRFGDFNARLERAVDNAINNGREQGIDGDMLVNVRINNDFWNAIIYGQDCISVTGELVTLKS